MAKTIPGAAASFTGVARKRHAAIATDTRQHPANDERPRQVPRPLVG
ncbi:hypothetical protein OAF93_00140 [Planctomycetota bacterium]|nr:hypothetical protein [Planctomycetota bacterium]